MSVELYEQGMDPDTIARMCPYMGQLAIEAPEEFDVLIEMQDLDLDSFLDEQEILAAQHERAGNQEAAFTQSGFDTGDVSATVAKTIEQPVSIATTTQEASYQVLTAVPALDTDKSVDAASVSPITLFETVAVVPVSVMTSERVYSGEQTSMNEPAVEVAVSASQAPLPSEGLSDVLLQIKTDARVEDLQVVESFQDYGPDPKSIGLETAELEAPLELIAPEAVTRRLSVTDQVEVSMHMTPDTEPVIAEETQDLSGYLFEKPGEVVSYFEADSQEVAELYDELSLLISVDQPEVRPVIATPLESQSPLLLEQTLAEVAQQEAEAMDDALDQLEALANAGYEPAEEVQTAELLSPELAPTDAGLAEVVEAPVGGASGEVVEDTVDEALPVYDVALIVDRLQAVREALEDCYYEIEDDETEVAADSNVLPVYEATAEEASADVVFEPTPELAKALIELLQSMGYEEPAAMVTQYARIYGLEALAQRLEQVCDRLPVAASAEIATSSGLTLLDDADTDGDQRLQRAGRIVRWLLRPVSQPLTAAA